MKKLITAFFATTLSLSAFANEELGHIRLREWWSNPTEPTNSRAEALQRKYSYIDLCFKNACISDSVNTSGNHKLYLQGESVFLQLGSNVMKVAELGELIDSGEYKVARNGYTENYASFMVRNVGVAMSEKTKVKKTRECQNDNDLGIPFPFGRTCTKYFQRSSQIQVKTAAQSYALQADGNMVREEAQELNVDPSDITIYIRNYKAL